MVVMLPAPWNLFGSALWETQALLLFVQTFEEMVQVWLRIQANVMMATLTMTMAVVLHE